MKFLNIDKQFIKGLITGTVLLIVLAMLIGDVSCNIDFNIGRTARISWHGQK